MIAQVGDSRVYRLRGGRALQLTDDHTLINHRIRIGELTPEEAARASGKNVITRAVGHRDYVEVDTFEGRVRSGDRFLLCTDGLHGYLGQGEVERLVVDTTPERACADAVALANDRGGKDNVTALVVAFS